MSLVRRRLTLAETLAGMTQEGAHEEFDQAPLAGLDLHADRHAREQGNRLAIDKNRRSVQARSGCVYKSDLVNLDGVPRHDEDLPRNRAVRREGEGIHLHLDRLV